MNGRESTPPGLFMIGTAALFMAGFLLLVSIGAHSFQNTAAGQNGNMETRAILSYLSTCVKSNDTAGAVQVRYEGEKLVLEVADGDTGYAQRIYLHEGNLVEDFARKDAELYPEDSSLIGHTDSFEISKMPGGVLAVTTDEGRVLLHTRCKGAGS
jgi:hypothetical protein